MSTDTQQQTRIALSLAEHVVRQAKGGRTIGEALRDIQRAQTGPAGPGPVSQGRMAYRDLSTASGPRGGYLKGTEALAVADLVRDGHYLGEVGVQYISGLTSDVTIPAVRAGITGEWVNLQSGTQITPSDPTLGQVSMVPHAAAGYTRYSRQLSLQHAALESTLSMLLREAVTGLLEQAVLTGAGGVAPLGIKNTAGVNTQAGAALSYAGLRAMRKAVLLAGAAERKLHWIGAPDVQETLGGRARIATTDSRTLWDDNGVMGRPATATAYADAGTLVVGDWSRCLIGIWHDAVELELDPFADFARALEGARLILHCDVAFPQPAAFAVATGVN
jgi:HK97 family phage major capsid protein